MVLLSCGSIRMRCECLSEMRWENEVASSGIDCGRHLRWLNTTAGPPMSVLV